jgi:hypothetical protein
MAQAQGRKEIRAVRPQCEYVSPIDGKRCICFASNHSGHLIPDDGESHELRESPEDSPDWDPEGIKASGQGSASS